MYMIFSWIKLAGYQLLSNGIQTKNSVFWSLAMWFSVTAYPTNTLHPTLQILHVSESLSVPHFLRNRRCRLLGCNCGGVHYVLSPYGCQVHAKDKEEEPKVATERRRKRKKRRKSTVLKFFLFIYVGVASVYSF